MPIPGHEVPPCETAAGHDQCDVDFLTPDKPMTDALMAAGFAGRLVLLVAGYNVDNGLYSRTRCSFQSNRHLEIGWAHFSGDNSEEFFQKLAREMPDVATFAFGPEKAAEMKTDAWVRATDDAFQGRTTMPPGYEWLYAGWAQICGRSDVQALYTQVWWSKYAASAIAWAKANDVRSARYVALMIRMLNSRPAYLSDLKAIWRDANGDASKAFEAAAALYTGGGNSSTRSRRVADVKKMFGPNERIESWPRPQAITWPKTPSDYAEGTGTGAVGRSRPVDSGTAPINTPWLLVGTIGASGLAFAYQRGWLKFITDRFR